MFLLRMKIELPNKLLFRWRLLLIALSTNIYREACSSFWFLMRYNKAQKDSKW